MATVGSITTFANGPASSAAAVNANFDALVTFLNGSVLHRDGSKTMSANLDAGNNEITGVSAASAATDGVPRSYIDTFNVAGVWTRTATQATGGTAPGTLVEFDVEVSDPLGIADLGSAPGDFVVPSDGLYQVQVEYYSVNSSGNFLQIATIRDGYDGISPPSAFGAHSPGLGGQTWSVIDSSSGAGHYYNGLTDVMFLSSGDTVRIYTITTAAYICYGVKLYILKLAD